MEWYDRKYVRSVENLKLWKANPRYNPNEELISITDFAEAIIDDEQEKISFYDLIKSIAQKFRPIDPIVVWKDEKNRFCVAEGNRRVLALKLLLNPNKAPKGMRKYVRDLSDNMPEKITKIHVYIAPSFEEASWYISQRNNTSSLRKSWSRLQQFRWIAYLFDNVCNKDMNCIQVHTQMSIAELEYALRMLNIIRLVESDDMKALLTEDEYKEANSHKFPITIIERFFSNVEVREKWGIAYDGVNVKIKNYGDFMKAFAAFLRNVLSKSEDRIKIDTRTITSNLQEILNKLPSVNLEVDEGYDSSLTSSSLNENSSLEDSRPKENKRDRKVPQKGDPYREKLILKCYSINASNYRLVGIFNELKKVNVKSCINLVASSIRIFLDLAIVEYVEANGLRKDFEEECNLSFREIPLKKRLNCLEKRLSKYPEAKKILIQLKSNDARYTLDILNGYQHSLSTAHLVPEYINGFWDFLFPLFATLLDIKEK